MQQTSPVQRVPPEILHDLFSLLPRCDMPCIRLVCRLWCDVVFSAFYGTVHIPLGGTIDDFILFLARTPAACACIRNLTFSLDHSDALKGEPLSVPLCRLSGKLNGISSLTLRLPPQFLVNKEWHGLKAFITSHCTSARCICLRGEFNRDARALDAFLSAFTRIHTLCAYKHVYLLQEGPPWPLGARAFNTALLTTLSFTFASPMQVIDPTWDFPALHTLDLHVDSDQAYWHGDDTAREVANILVHILTHSVYLRLIRYFHSKRFRGSPIYTILGQLLCILPHREFTLLLGVHGHIVPDAVRGDLQQADALFSQDAPEASARIVLSCDLPDLPHLMPNLHAKGQVRCEGRIPSHDH